MVRAQWNSPQFLARSRGNGCNGLGSCLTLRVNIPINNELMTWSVTAPPENMMEI